MQKRRVIIFGAGGSGRKVFQAHAKDLRYEIVSFVDNSEQAWGELFGLPVFSPEHLTATEFDEVWVAVSVGTSMVCSQLESIGVAPEKIVIPTEIAVVVQSRILFLERLAVQMQDWDPALCVAEAGVFQGEFAVQINRCFPARKLYLFDTFEGFAGQDVAYEKEKRIQAGMFRETSEELVLGRLPHPEQAVIRKGWFPQTAQDVEEHFCFVNMDLDLYKPTLEGLRLFWPRMVPNGVILVHDYFNDRFPNVKQAVDEFAAEAQAKTLPIGDGISIALIR